MKDKVIFGKSISSEQPSQLPGKNIAFVAFFVSLGGGFNFGYQLLITNPAQEAFIQFTNSSLINQGIHLKTNELEANWGIIVSTLFWGATIGAFLIQYVADKFGRTRGLVISLIFQSIGCALSIISFFIINHILYAVSRIILGAAISISLGIAPLFITECSPARCRGVISLATGIMIQIALVVGATVAMPQVLGTKDNWWILYAIELVFTIIVTIVCAFMKESPGYLLSLAKREQAKLSVIYYHDIDECSAEKLIIELEQTNGQQETFGLFSVFKDKQSLRGTLLGSTIITATTLSGIAAINAFAFEILQSVGLSSLEASIGNITFCLMTVFGVIFSSFLIDRKGRRPLLLSTFGLLGLINVIIYMFMILFEKSGNLIIGWGVVLAICIFNFVICVGPAPISFFITGELVSQNGRGAACTWVNVVFNGVRSILLAVYFPLKIVLGGPLAYLLLFFPPCIISAIILYYYLPETKGKTPEEAQRAAKELPLLCKKKVKTDTLLLEVRA